MSRRESPHFIPRRLLSIVREQQLDSVPLPGSMIRKQRQVGGESLDGYLSKPYFAAIRACEGVPCLAVGCISLVTVA